jgi:uncharacterized protein (TIGR04551 family)
MRARKLTWLAALWLALPATALAQAEEAPAEESDDSESGRSLLDELTAEMEAGDSEWEGVPEEQARTYPYIEHDGYFRFRSDLFFRPHLGVAVPTADGSSTVTTSGFLPPVSRNTKNSGDNSQLSKDDKGEETIAGANMRLRYSPTIHVADWLRIHATFDIFDNIVLGSTPDYAYFRPDAALVLFSGGQAPPSALQNALVDSVRVKEAYGEVRAIFGNIRFGRMASHWGMGLLANGGTGIDSDYGDYIDRVMLVTRLWGVYLAFAWDFVGEGLIAQDPDQFFGQPYDADQLDDVIEVVGALFQRPIADEEIDRRRRLLTEERRASFDWGAYVVYRQQKYDLESGQQPAYTQSVTAQNYDKFKFIERDSWVVIPDLWWKVEWQPTYSDRLRIEFEAALIYGKINGALDEASDPENAKRDVLQWGGALQAEYQRSNLSIFFETGVASGDSAQFLGVRDQVNFFENDGGPNRKVTNFKFDRNYYVDLILFREVIGGVTNAAYVKPGVQYDLFDSVDDSLGGRVDIITAWALEPKATPGQESWYGIEFDASIFYEERNRFRADLAWGTLVPGSAFNLKASPAEPYLQATESKDVTDFAMTVQARFFLMF